jgi:hypothetical protein
LKHIATGKRILCLHEEDYAYDTIRQILSDKGYFVYDYPDANAAFAHIYNEPCHGSIYQNSRVERIYDPHKK